MTSRPPLIPYRPEPPLIRQTLVPYRPDPPVIRQNSPKKPTLEPKLPTITARTTVTPASQTSAKSSTTPVITTQYNTSKGFKSPQKPKPEKKTPLEIIYMRRASVREQKRQSIAQNIQFLPAKLIYGQMAILGFIALAMISLQIAIIVEKTSLYFICSGFWCAGVLIMCIIYLFLLEITRTHKNFIICVIFHALGFLTSLGLIIVNSIDMAMFNVQCILACFRFSYQFLGLIMVIFGTIAMIDFGVFAFGIDYFILRESRAINTYLENKKPKRKF